MRAREGANGLKRVAQAIQAGLDGPNRGGDFNAVHYDVGEDGRTARQSSFCAPLANNAPGPNVASLSLGGGGGKVNSMSTQKREGGKEGWSEEPKANVGLGLAPPPLCGRHLRPGSPLL